MKIEKHFEALKEVDETIEEALNSKNILSYQRRLSAMLSLGIQQLIEIYLHRLNVIRPGTQVKHEWFGIGERKLHQRLSAILTTEAKNIPRIREILILAKEIESDRNDILYGSPLSDESTIKGKIDAYLEVKRIIEEEHGQRGHKP